MQVQQGRADKTEEHAQFKETNIAECLPLWTH